MSDFEPPDPREPDDSWDEHSFWTSDPPHPDEPAEFDPVLEGMESAASIRRLRDRYPVAPLEHVPAFVPITFAVVGLVGLASFWLFDNGAALSAMSVAAGVVTLAFAADLGHDHFTERAAEKSHDERRVAWGPEVATHAFRLAAIAHFVEEPVLLKRWARLLGELSNFATDQQEHEASERLAYARALVLAELRAQEIRTTRGHQQ